MARRPLRFLKDLPRHHFASHYRRALETIASRTGDWPSESTLTVSAIWEWVKAVLSNVFTPKKPFVAATAPDYSIYHDASQEVTIGIAGDWGAGTDEAHCVATGIAHSNPDYTIHLGDIYLVGDSHATLTNCLGKIPKGYAYPYDPVKWPSGKKGSFAMNGNHEMYAKGIGYFEEFLPTLGLAGHGKKNHGQKTSFFALVFEKWIVIAVDTGYNSMGLPMLGQLPGSGNPLLHWLEDHLTNPSCKLEDPLVEWLRNRVNPLLNGRSVVIMSHHNYFSEFPEQFNYDTPAKQILSALGVKDAVWIWGHEHRLAGYKYYGTTDLKCHGRCIGNGGMPIRLCEKVPAQSSNLLFFDNRTYSAPDKFGWNGYATLTIASDLMTVRYYDIHSIQKNGEDRLLIEEEFRHTDGPIHAQTKQICLTKDFYGPKKWG